MSPPTTTPTWPCSMTSSSQCFDKLEPGGRIAVNVANLGRKPVPIPVAGRHRPARTTRLPAPRGDHLAEEPCRRRIVRLGHLPATRQPGVARRVRTDHVASKGRFDRAITPDQRARQGLPSEGTMTMDEFVDATIDVWDIPAESATRVGHPAPFPVELPRRLIELYTYRGDLILDPFVGSGSTAVAAVRTERHYVGFDTDEEYVALAERRIAEERAALALPPSAGTARRVTVSPGRAAPPMQEPPPRSTP